jgi:hypothetical protein
LVDVWIQEEKPASTNESAKYRRMTKQSLGVLQQVPAENGCRKWLLRDKSSRKDYNSVCVSLDNDMT